MGGFECGWGGVAGAGFDLAVEAPVVEPVHVGKGGELDVFEALPRGLFVDELSLIHIFYEPSSGAMGGGGVTTWTLSVIAAGTISIALKQWRPWEGDASVLDRFTLTVHARL